MSTSNQSNSGPTRTGQISTRRFQPYGTSHTRENGYQDAGAGPSTLVPSQVPHVDSPTLQPIGGVIPQAVANANTKNSNTEEQKVPVSHFYRPPIPHVTYRLCDIRCPTTPGDPMDKGSLAQVVRRHRLMAVSCAAWLRGGKGTETRQALRRL